MLIIISIFFLLIDISIIIYIYFLEKKSALYIFTLYFFIYVIIRTYNTYNTHWCYVCYRLNRLYYVYFNSCCFFLNDRSLQWSDADWEKLQSSDAFAHVFRITKLSHIAPLFSIVENNHLFSYFAAPLSIRYYNFQQGRNIRILDSIGSIMMTYTFLFNI